MICPIADLGITARYHESGENLAVHLHINHVSSLSLTATIAIMSRSATDYIIVDPSLLKRIMLDSHPAVSNFVFIYTWP
jgi:hypothetical protein